LLRRCFCSCGIDFSRDDLLCCLACFRAQEPKSVSSSCGGRVTFLLLVQKGSNQEKTRPGGACRASLPGKSVSRAPGWRASCVAARAGQRGVRSYFGFGLGFAPSPACRGRLGGGKALDLRTKSNPSPTLPCTQGREHICRTARKVLALSGAWLGFASALLLVQLLQTVRAGRAPLYPGPLCGGEVGSTGPVGGIGRTPIPFRQHRDVLSKKPGPTSRTFWAGCPESATRGGLLFWLLFSWPRKRKVTRPPQEDETLVKL
jgi:hypothetical protein